MQLEVREQEDTTGIFGNAVLVTADIHEDYYWMFRVRLTDTQAVVGFPKFGTIGIGFAEETKPNVNLPYRSGTASIVAHILCNKGDDTITDADVTQAVELVVQAAKLYKEGPA
jgi:hypothetical protein